jgi:hypothetical protein
MLHRPGNSIYFTATTFGSVQIATGLEEMRQSASGMANAPVHINPNPMSFLPQRLFHPHGMQVIPLLDQPGGQPLLPGARATLGHTTFGNASTRPYAAWMRYKIRNKLVVIWYPPLVY